MDRASHVLAFQLSDVEHLHGIFGEAAVASALADTKVALDRAASRLRGRHGAVTLPSSHKPNRWLCGIAMLGLGTGLLDATEQADAIAIAAHAAVREVLIGVFGPGTGAKLRFVTLVLPLPNSYPSGLDVWLDREQENHVVNDRAANHHRAELDAIVAGRGLRTFLQPIVALPSGEVVGYEALSRGPKESALESADALFGAALQCGRTKDLELACAHQALALVPHLPSTRWMSINLGLETFAFPGVVDALAKPRVALEITEHLPLDQADRHGSLFERAREHGAPIVLDDTGCGFADTDAAQAIRPDIVKLCITITRNADRGARYLGEIANAIEQFRSSGAQVLAEGVETLEQAQAMASAGATLAQGWYFGRPVPVEDQSSNLRWLRLGYHIDRASVI